MNVGLFPLGRIVITPAALEAFERSGSVTVWYFSDLDIHAKLKAVDEQADGEVVQLPGL